MAPQLLLHLIFLSVEKVIVSPIELFPYTPWQKSAVCACVGSFLDPQLSSLDMSLSSIVTPSWVLLSRS